MRTIPAAKAAANINAELEAFWRGLYLGRADEAQRRYEAARQFTWALGFDALPAAELIERPADEIVARVKAIQARGIKPNSDAADAALGLVLRPALKLSGLVSAYEATQRWRTTKERAVAVETEARRAAAEDRQKIAEMVAELRSTSRSVSRIEALLDRMMMERAPKVP